MIRDTLFTFTTKTKTASDVYRMMSTRLDAGRATYVAEADGTLLGFATYDQFRSGPGYSRTMEHTVIVNPKACGSGVGRLLMAEIEVHAGAAGAGSMIAGISSANPRAIRFHTDLGYVHVGTIPEVGWKRERWLDLVLMQKRLDARVSQVQKHP